MTVQNNVQLIGRLTKDLEGQFIETKKGDDLFLARVTLAVDRPHRAGEDNGADFIRLKFIGNRWENVANYLLKGTQVAIQGAIETGQYENQDGDTVYTTEVTVDQLQLLGSPNKDNQNKQSNQKRANNRRQARR